MNSKVDRQRIIREIVTEGRIASQEELASILESRGIAVAQATLSRDIREMEISKHRDDRGFYYGFSGNARPQMPSRPSDGISDSIESIGFSGPLAVIKTRPGHANMVASIIDGGSVTESAGTIAGDDTILVVIREGFSRDDLVASLSRLFRRIGSKRIN